MHYGVTSHVESVTAKDFPVHVTGGIFQHTILIIRVSVLYVKGHVEEKRNKLLFVRSSAILASLLDSIGLKRLLSWRREKAMDYIATNLDTREAHAKDAVSSTCTDVNER